MQGSIKYFATALLLLAAPFSVQANDVETPKVQITEAGAPFLSGGIGEDEQLFFATQRKNFNVHLKFAAAKSGEYLSDVQVEISKDTKIVLSTTTTGPFLLAKLPMGQYVVSAKHNGETKTAKLSVNKNQAREAVIYFAE